MPSGECHAEDTVTHKALGRYNTEYNTVALRTRNSDLQGQ